MKDIFTDDFKQAVINLKTYTAHRKPSAEQLQAFTESQLWLVNDIKSLNSIKSIEVEHEDGHYYVVNIYLKNKHYISLYFPGDDEE